MPDGLTVLGLLRHLNIQHERVAVELNLDIVRKADYALEIITGTANAMTAFVSLVKTDPSQEK